MMITVHLTKIYFTILSCLTTASIFFNVYAYNEILKLSSFNEEYKASIQKLELKFVSLPEKVLDSSAATKIQIITQQDSVLSYIYLGVSVIGIIILFYLIYTLYIQLCGLFTFKTLVWFFAPATPFIERFIIKADKHFEAIDTFNTIIRIDLKTINNIDTFVISIKRVGDASFTVIENIGKIIADNPEAVAEISQTLAERLACIVY